jgi:glycosyltransferase involved in cell wall biosynthesis
VARTSARAPHLATAPELGPSAAWDARTVLVHDYLNQHGGAERVLEVMHDLAPDAPVFTSLYDPAHMPDMYRGWDIRTSWVDRLPGARRAHQRVLPAYPLAFERLRLPRCELVLSSSSAFAKMVAPPPGATHIAYIHSPMRFAWDLDNYIERERLPDSARRLLRPAMVLLRQRDCATLPRVQRLIANSTAVRNRIRAFWRRDAAVIFPPVDVELFEPAPAEALEDYFLIVSRLVPYKRLDLAIEAFNALGLPLLIAGAGRDHARLQAMAGPMVRFLGHVSDAQRRELYARCRAAVFMSEDDFGIAQVEAQAAGRPVIAYAAGGVFDTVVPDQTGVYVAEQSAASLIEAVRRFERLCFAPECLVTHAQAFSRARFERELVGLVRETLDARRSGERMTWN